MYINCHYNYLRTMHLEQEDSVSPISFLYFTKVSIDPHSLQQCDTEAHSELTRDAQHALTLQKKDKILILGRQRSREGEGMAESWWR